MNTIPTVRRCVLLALALAAAALGVRTAEAQIGGLRRAAEAAAGRMPDPTRLLQAPPPITTALPDAVWGVDSLDGREPGTPTTIRSLERGPNGGFILRPGIYEHHAQSYCLKAGTHGPGEGDGYLFAPPRGPAEDAVVSIVRNSVRHPDIPQGDIQVLLWAIIARAKFEQMEARLKATAARLLTPQQIASLNRNALDLLPGPALDRALASMPGPVRQVFEAEANLRRMLQSAGGTFEEMERVAVLTGMAPRGEGSRDVPSGRWSRHPDGYFVRYLPQGYSYTVVHVWVPEGSPAVGREFDPSRHIAVPGNTSRQRLIQSARARDR